MPSYQYPALPLPEAGKYTRLLRLSPGDFSDDLHVELKQVLLDGTPNYEALSYVWGSSANPVSILVGPSRKHTISVTQNLATALQHLRDANESRTLWVDAVCIDQSDVKERSYQVTLMSDIYRDACQVVVWLGPEDDDSFHAFNVLHDIGSSIDINRSDHSFKLQVADDNSSSSKLEDLRNYRFRDEEIHAVNRLLHRPWFERLWIRQEIGLATQALVCCGRLTMPWYLFGNAIFFVFLEGPKLMTETLGDHAASFASRIFLADSICNSDSYCLEGLRGNLADALCADPRDKIYGILSLLPPNQRTMGIVPDYTRNVALVYQDATLRFIDHMNLSILVQCELQDTPPHMPTWVPDWSTKLRARPFTGGPSDASAHFESIAASKGEGTLSVAGVVVATIKHVQPLNFGDSEDDFRTMLMALSKMIISISASSTVIQASQLSSVCDALCCGTFRHRSTSIRENFPDFQWAMQTFKSIFTTSSSSVEDPDSVFHWTRYKAWVRSLCHDRSFLVGTEGSIGVAPLSARPGDIVCVLLGCYTPILLRQTRADTYQVVGQSYMPGF